MLEEIEKSTYDTQKNNDSQNNSTDGDNATTDNDPIVDIMDINFSKAIIQAENKDNIGNNDAKEEKKKADLKVIGRIEITRVGIDLIIVEGTSQYVLMYGAGHMANTAYPGESGNCVLAGHRGYAGATFFYRLHKLKIGDIIKVTYFDQIYNYSVVDSYKVLPTDLSVLKQEDDKKELTLITCDPPVTGTHRIIIKAILIENEEKSEWSINCFK